MTTAICYPPGTDWSCAFSTEELDAMRADPEKLAMMEKSEALAWMSLATLTADQIGTCPITVRPCKLGCNPGGVYLTAPVVGLSGRFNPHINGQGVWVNSCGCTTDCSCTTLCEAILPGPVGDIVEILLDGAVLDPSAYRVDNGNRLVRTDGGCWPACQDMSKPGTAQYEPVVVDWPTATVTFTRRGDNVEMLLTPKGTNGNGNGPLPYAAPDSFSTSVELNGQGILGIESGSYAFFASPFAVPTTLSYITSDPPAPNDAAGTFEVTYYRGAAPDVVLLWMAGLLASEWYKACANDKTCRLPRGARNVSRQGIQYEIERNLFSEGTTGIPEVDALVARYNPYGLKMAPTISTPQTIRRPRQTTWSR